MLISETTDLSVAVFPRQALEACLRSELLHEVESIAGQNEIQMPVGANAQASMSIQLDSLVVVELICATEAILGFPLKDDVVRAGGYRSINDALGHLMPNLEKEWQKFQTKRGKK